MHSICTAVSNDVIGIFKSAWTDKDQLRFARLLVGGLGILGTAIAIIMSTMDTGHMFGFLIGLMGLIASPLVGFFLLGLFAKKANATHIWIGVTSSLIAIVFAKYFTDLNGLLFGLVGIGICFGIDVTFRFPEGSELTDRINP